jgi:hypothetical protein
MAPPSPAGIEPRLRRLFPGKVPCHTGSGVSPRASPSAIAFATSSRLRTGKQSSRREATGSTRAVRQMLPAKLGRTGGPLPSGAPNPAPHSPVRRRPTRQSGLRPLTCRARQCRLPPPPRRLRPARFAGADLPKRTRVPFCSRAGKPIRCWLPGRSPSPDSRRRRAGRRTEALNRVRLLLPTSQFVARRAINPRLAEAWTAVIPA